MNAKVTLTPEEMDSVSTWDDGSYHCPCDSYVCVCHDSDKVHLYDAVALLIAARVAEALSKPKIDADRMAEIDVDWTGWGDPYVLAVLEEAMEELRRYQALANEYDPDGGTSHDGL